MENVIVYSKKGCGNCVGVKMFLKQHNIPHEIRDVFSDPAYLEEFRSYGFDSLPVVVSPNGEVHSGFKPQELIKIKSQVGL